MLDDLSPVFEIPTIFRVHFLTQLNSGVARGIVFLGGRGEAASGEDILGGPPNLYTDLEHNWEGGGDGGHPPRPPSYATAIEL